MQTPDFDPVLKKRIIDTLRLVVGDLKRLYQQSLDEQAEYSFFLDENGNIRNVIKGHKYVHGVLQPGGEYIPTFLSGHVHYKLPGESSDGPSGDDLFIITKQVREQLSLGEIIICPDRIWVIVLAPKRIQDFSEDDEWKFLDIGQGESISRQYRLGRIKFQGYLAALHEYGFDTLVLNNQDVL